ncbi:MAG: DNA-processing protein DprA [Candidatus Pacebacteria bacterium]|jgi:DNA processing protein|nr:DNA-processing protein DprA [Candidatus Paceibacterota bacterium]
MEYEISKISESDIEFPNCLRTIPSRPKVLYVRGRLDLAAPCVAVVGSRLPSAYGKQAVADIVGTLSRAGVCVVSGMAPGVDTLAHQTALEYDGKTIGVVGTGLDEKSFFPKPNLDLAQKIVDTGGCLVSEYPAGYPAARYTFPQRNRIIAGLSLAVLVVEAKEKSGSLLTAEWARKQHKPVFAVPGSIYMANSKGCNWLLKNGAKACDSATDILNLLGIAPAGNNIAASQNPEEQKILDTLKDGAKDIDEIIKSTQLPAQTVLSLIPVMELNNLIKNIEFNTYAIKTS